MDRKKWESLCFLFWDQLWICVFVLFFFFFFSTHTINMERIFFSKLYFFGISTVNLCFCIFFPTYHKYGKDNFLWWYCIFWEVSTVNLCFCPFFPHAYRHHKYGKDFFYEENMKLGFFSNISHVSAYLVLRRYLRVSCFTYQHI